ncbi:NUDIX hydrolase [Shimia sp. SDUM112013]|uniref:NUDIX hydrolase n=1 Tax=Shimia sp. SDUM112013 TaxID=3136160 RepID=UPI0032ED1283
MTVSRVGHDDRAFHGAKLAVFVGRRLATLLRDDKPNIPWPGYWDLPGGGREGTETGVQCAVRETHEELGLIIPLDAPHWGRMYWRKGLPFWFLAVNLPASAEADIRLGDEGQGWKLMDPMEYMIHPKAIPPFQSRLADYLAGLPSE